MTVVVTVKKETLRNFCPTCMKLAVRTRLVEVCRTRTSAVYLRSCMECKRPIGLETIDLKGEGDSDACTHVEFRDDAAPGEENLGIGKEIR